MSNIIKPCVHCRPDRLGVPRPAFFYDRTVYKNTVQVYCPTCRMHGPIADDAEDAINLWNALPRTTPWPPSTP